MKDELREEDPDKVWWIDTSVQLCDPLTKRMRADRLRKAMEDGILDLVPSDRSILNNMKKQKKEDATEEA